MSNHLIRRQVSLYGAVQGTGFRPFLYRLARELGLNGWVCNTAFGLLLEVEGGSSSLEVFLQRLDAEKPAHAMVTATEWQDLPPCGFGDFQIRASQEGEKRAFILPDMALCQDCREEILTSGNRRYRYPFTNCTQCGPRFTILTSLPYDRPNTTMRSFAMCPECLDEYQNPLDRRFHAQPIACPRCGPHLAFWNEDGELLSRKEEALQETIAYLRRGKIVALKGIGGFQLLVDACNPSAVERLRLRKRREEKPFALMYPSLGLVKADCQVDDAEERILKSSAAPIVLLARRPAMEGSDRPAAVVAPGNPYLGVMLPYSPLHELLLGEVGRPLVVTSGNLSDEPMCIEEQEAVQRLRGIADGFLVHNRPVVRPVDDSVVRVLLGNLQILRRARGFSPLPIPLTTDTAEWLAVGGHLKNTVALSRGRQVFLSQHIGDLDTLAADRVFRQTISTLSDIYQIRPQRVVCDCHPEYRSTIYAEESGLPVTQVQHHAAHALSVIAEHGLHPPVLAVVWDGSGYGLDGSVWGGEWFLYEEKSLRRIGHLRPFRLPGNEKAIREPFRSAFGLLWEYLGRDPAAMEKMPWVHPFHEKERKAIYAMLRAGQNSPWSSSIGRLFDAVASLTGLRHQNRFEGQTAMQLEFQAHSLDTAEFYPIHWFQGLPDFLEPTAIPRWIADWQPLLADLLADLDRGVSLALIAAKFHNALCEGVVAFAKRLQVRQVAVSGGCFQNRYLVESLGRRLSEESAFYWQQKVPTNDGGIALGQLFAVAQGITLL